MIEVYEGFVTRNTACHLSVTESHRLRRTIAASPRALPDTTGHSTRTVLH
jgi:hypothetical protein